MYDYNQAYGAQPFAPQQFVPQQLAPQGFGSMFGGLIGNLAGRGIGGLFGSSGTGGRIGQAAGNFLGNLSPFSVDPSQQIDPQQLYQAQLAQQPPEVQMQQLQAFHQQLQQMLQQIQQQQAALQQHATAQQGDTQLAPQSNWVSNLVGQYAQPVGSFLGNQLGNPTLGNALGTVASQFSRLIPFQAGPYNPYAQQAQYGGQQTLH